MPEHWRFLLPRVLLADEQVLAFLELDLNTQLRYSNSLLCLTTHGLLASKTGQSLTTLESREAWEFWPYSANLRLNLHDHAGVASLELCHESGRLALWRFTLAQNPAANRLMQQYKLELGKFLGKIDPASDELVGQPLCPTCWVPLPPDQDDCPACTSENMTPPSTWTLFRLWRFAKPYKGQLLAGFLLTLASTAATLVPPYLTMPLMDDILLPYQSGKPIDYALAGLYLGGLLLAALLAWS